MTNHVAKPCLPRTCSCLWAGLTLAVPLTFFYVQGYVHSAPLSPLPSTRWCDRFEHFMPISHKQHENGEIACGIGNTLAVSLQTVQEAAERIRPHAHVTPV